MNELPEFGLKDEYRTHDYPLPRMMDKKGPNRWEEVKDDSSAYGRYFDFRVMDGNVFMPCCLAAQEYVYAHFPEDATYYTLAPDDGACYTGVVVDRGMDIVLERAARAGLISEDYALNALEAERR